MLTQFTELLSLLAVRTHVILVGTFGLSVLNSPRGPGPYCPGMASNSLRGRPTLLAVVTQWDALVRRNLPPTALWYATLARDGMSFTGKTHVGRGRGSAARKGIKKLVGHLSRA